MKIAFIGKQTPSLTLYPTLDITTIDHPTLQTLTGYDMVIISGGDGLIRRVVRLLDPMETKPTLILNPTGSFNVVAKFHRTPKLSRVLERLTLSEDFETKTLPYYRINDDIFLFSAGNMGDLHHIFLSESLRFGWLKHGSFKYIIAFLFLLPFHLVATPFMLMSDKRFFIFTPLAWIKKFGSFYGKVEAKQRYDLQNSYNILELDGDIVVIPDSIIEIEPKGVVKLVVG
jgi:Diacylglycerol kinase catalytic domain